MATENARMKKPLRIVLIGVIGLAVLAAGIFAYMLFFNDHRIDNNMLMLSDDGRFYQGVVVNNVDVGGLTYDEADRAVIETEDSTVEDVRIQLLTEDGKTYSVTGPQMGVESNRGDVLNQAMLVGRTGTVLER
ncbi:MAG: hypothetical protein ACOYI4_06605, partial [Christensenellales bacterium]